MTEDILEIRIAGAIYDFEEISHIPITEEVVSENLQDYAELFYDMQVSIGFLPVPLEIMHTRNVCDFWGIYKGFEELKRLYIVNRTCENAIADVDQIETVGVEPAKLLEWLSKYRLTAVEVHFLPQKSGNYLPFSFRTGINFLVPFVDFESIFKLNHLYERILEQNPNITLNL